MALTALRMTETDDITVERVRRARKFATFSAVVSMAIGAMVLLGWIVGNTTLQGAISDNVTMKANAALCLLLAGVSLYLSVRDLSSAGLRFVRVAAGALVSLIGLATLSQHLFGWNLGIDQLFFAEAPDSPATASPGRMGPPASTGFALIGIALVLLRQRRPRPLVAQYLVALTVVIAVPGILGHLYGAEQLYALRRLTGIALPTGIALTMLALGVLSARADTGLSRLFVREDPGGAVLRRIILPSTAIVVILGWLSALVQQRRLADPELAAAILVVVLMVFLLIIGAHNARALNAVAHGRAEAERDRERLLESERAARTDAERAARTKDEFLTTISHELRTPLSGILGWTQVLKRADDQAIRARAVEAIERGAFAQAKLIDDLLDVSSIISGKVRLDVTTLDLGPLVESAIATLAPAAEAKSITVQRVIDPRAGPIKGDGARMQQVIWNLLANAIKFTSKGGKVQLYVERIQSSVVVTVSDNGVGIAPTFLPHVFDRFRQQDGSAARTYGGLGLGLAIVKHIVDLHGGSVTAASDGEGKGATFTVTLPIAIAATESTPEHPLPAVGAGSPLNGVTVLLVDDDRDSLDSVRQLLSEYGAKVLVSESALDALDRLESVRPHIVVADIGMPNMDGYTMIQQLRTREAREGRRMPAIALTAFSRAEDRIRALEAGYNIHLSKPVDLRELIAAIASLVSTPRVDMAAVDS